MKKIKPVEQPKEVKVAKVKSVETEKPVEPKVLKFKNVGKGIKIKLIDEKDRKKFKWITVKPGEIVSIPRKIALRNKLVEVK